MSALTSFTLGTLLTLGTAAAQPARGSAPFAEITERFVRDRGFSGVVLVARGGMTVYSGAFGTANPTTRTANTIATPFRVASVSKLLMAVTALRLQEEGKLKLDAPINTYWPAVPGAAGQVTVRHLLMHTSGLPNPEVRETPPINAYRSKLSLDAYLAKYLGAPLTTPGTRFSYNNLDYVVLSKVIERASGQPWFTAVKRRVLDPAGMKSSGLITDEREPANLARGQYKDASGAWTPDPPFFVYTYFGGAALYSTAPDLARFDAALRGNKLITRASQRTLFDGRPDFGYVALGNWVSPQTLGANTVRISERYGNVWGSFSIFARGLDTANTVIVLSNRHDGAANVENALKGELLAALYR